MKSRVVLSAFARCLTAIITITLITGCILTFNEKPAFWGLVVILLFLLIVSAIYAPISISIGKRYITVNSLVKRHRILLENVAEVKLFQPTLGSLRICGSGGYWGYYGIFKEGDIGRYVAYYGKASDCFLVRMKNGDKYVLGCKDPAAAVDYINAFINKG